MAVRIIRRRDGMYDIYDRTSDKWLASFPASDNVLAWLSKKKFVWIDFIDEKN